MLKRSLIVLSALLLPAYAFGQEEVTETVAPHNGETGLRTTAPYGETVEQYLPLDAPYTPWVTTSDDEQGGDKIETQQVLQKELKTLKLQNVVPPIRFASGKADIPEEYIDKLREVLVSMKGRLNVRLHFLGHTDNVKLRGALKEKYGDNAGLSRERAGTTAEYFQQALDLPPESISYEGVGEAQPLASNNTLAGRAQNRRVEVEVWYDEEEEKLVDKEVLVTEEMNRIKVCRIETVCRLRYKEGHAKRGRIKNLVAPLRFDETSTEVPASFIEQLRQAQHNLRGKENVVMKFIGHNDNLPLTGREERIYGDAMGISKARARRVALAVQDAMHLPSAAVDSSGKGDRFPVASNDTEKGRMLNRRVEVEFWYDDPLQELPEEPQLCPESSAAETVVRVYDPPSGPIAPVYFKDGTPLLSPGYSQRLERLMSEIPDKANVRLRFVGYISNERLDRRTASVYGDDIGLSTARARRVMEAIRTEITLRDKQVEYEGHGYVQSDDVINAGFVEADRSRVVVQVVYDELAMLDDSEGIDITRLTREVETQNPYSLNFMRITVDGKPLNDPGKNIPDVQRCTDVALEKAQIQFKYDNLGFKPRLNVTAWPTTVRYADDINTAVKENEVRFRLYSNYRGFIERAEVRIFDKEQSTRDEPKAIVPLDADGKGLWSAECDCYLAPRIALNYLVRVYDARGNFDESDLQQLWLVDQVDTAKLSESDADRELLVGYGENRLLRNNIPLSGGTIMASGSAIPEGHTVWLAGHPVPLNEKGEFIAEELLPAGLHTVEVAVLNEQGNGELFLRDLELQKSDWFYVGIADITASQDSTNGPAELVTNDKSHYDNDLSLDGRLAFYTHGKFGEGWELIASADTREGPLGEIFSNFLNKSPDALFRRIDPDNYYPTFGDDSTVEEGAPTMGKFYARLMKGDHYGLWGNFKIGYTDNTLAQVDRGLYGANLHLQPQGTTSFGEPRIYFDGYVAEPGTIAGRDEFRGTGGSLYFLRHQDILSGSERVRIEVRDKDSGMVVAVKNLTPALDYDMDYIQGRLILTEPLSATAADSMLVDSGGANGGLVYLVTRYEFTPGFDDINTLAVGGRTHYWFNDSVKLGLTASQSEEAGVEQSLNGVDITWRKGVNTWVKLESSQSQGPGSDSFGSADGGYTFNTASPTLGNDVSAGATRIDTSIALNELSDGLQGKVTLYQQQVEAGFSAPGLITDRDTTNTGATFEMPIAERVTVRAKSDLVSKDQGLETSAHEVNVHYLLTDQWTLSGAVRQDERTDNSPLPPVTQEEGERTDLMLQAAYDSKADWDTYGFVQGTAESSGNRDNNNRFGAGGRYRVNERFKMNGELSGGDLGSAVSLGTEYLYSDRTNLYTNYALENERSDNGVRARRGNLTSGFRTHYSDSTSVYLEERYTHGDVPTGLTHSAGIDIAPNDRWNYGANVDYGLLKDPQTAATTERSAFGARIGYKFEKLLFASAFEYRVDENENPLDATLSKRTTWLTRNSARYQLTESWRIIGKINHSESESSLGEFYNGDFTEAVMGYAYRPVEHDRLNALFKYTYFYNLPATDQVTLANTAAEYIQKSHILALDLSYDLSQRFTVGGKYAYRKGELSQERVNPVFFDSDAELYVARLDWHFVHRWDALVEWRTLQVHQAEDKRSGALVGLYRHFGENIKFGGGYNFTDFSDDLTDLDYDSQGVFINLVGKI
ncbi:MAG: OmpA family protein [Chromatiales bacterium]|nr:OmpA family protein [Chromatiales bacterium]